MICKETLEHTVWVRVSVFGLFTSDQESEVISHFLLTTVLWDNYWYFPNAIDKNT